MFLMFYVVERSKHLLMKQNIEFSIDSCWEDRMDIRHGKMFHVDELRSFISSSPSHPSLHSVSNMDDIK